MRGGGRTAASLLLGTVHRHTHPRRPPQLVRAWASSGSASFEVQAAGTIPLFERCFGGRAHGLKHSPPSLEPTRSAQAEVEGVIASVSEASSQAKLVTLLVEDERFKFAAGQWVDFCIPGIQQIGGYSICSTPAHLRLTRHIHLVVKQGRHPPAVWIHSQAHVGAKVGLRVGGSFTARKEDLQGPMLLIAGGIGITPLYSILRDAVERSRGQDLVATLLYMARGDKQHVMVADLRETESIALAKGVKVQCTLFDSSRNTKEPRSRSGPSWPRMCCSKHSVGVETASIRSNSHAAKYMNQRWEENCFPESGLMSINTSSASNAAWGARGSDAMACANRCIPGRVSKEHMQQALEALDVRKQALSLLGPTTVFICGPPKMADDIEACLIDIGVGKEQIRLERWW